MGLPMSNSDIDHNFHQQECKTNDSGLDSKFKRSLQQWEVFRPVQVIGTILSLSFAVGMGNEIRQGFDRVYLAGEESSVRHPGGEEEEPVGEVGEEAGPFGHGEGGGYSKANGKNEPCIRQWIKHRQSRHSYRPNFWTNRWNQ